MKFNSFLILLFFFGTAVYSQTIVISGSTTRYVNGRQRNEACYWMDGEYHSLSIGSASDVFVDGQDFYITGTFNEVGHWKNGNPIKYVENGVGNDIFVNNSDVYVAGHRDINKRWQPGYWINGVWNSLPFARGDAEDIIVTTTDIIITGWIYNSTGEAVPGYWKNGIWNNYEPANSLITARVFSSIIINSKLYSGGYGYFDKNQYYRVPTIWSESSRQLLSKLDNTGNDPGHNVYTEIQSLYNYQDKIVAVGWSVNSCGQWIPGYWFEGVWNGLIEENEGDGKWVRAEWIGNGEEYSGIASNVVIENGNIIIVGYRWSTSFNHQTAGYWINNNWIELSVPNVTTSKATSIAVLY